jgi:hypothetical protein
VNDDIVDDNLCCVNEECIPEEIAVDERGEWVDAREV